VKGPIGSPTRKGKGVNFSHWQESGLYKAAFGGRRRCGLPAPPPPRPAWVQPSGPRVRSRAKTPLRSRLRVRTLRWAMGRPENDGILYWWLCMASKKK